VQQDEKNKIRALLRQIRQVSGMTRASTIGRMTDIFF
jgi:hypothetical protein